MNGDASQPGSGRDLEGGPVFVTTHWSLVLTAGQATSRSASEALEQLCRAYWYPLYAFVRRQGYPAPDAEDLTQDFFARFLAKEYFGRADPARGRFRNFLLASLKNFLFEEHRQAGRLKRGGGQRPISWDSQSAEERYQSEPVDPVTPETIYDRRWALILLERALARLGEEQAAAGKAEVFDTLKSSLWGEGRGTGYAEAAAALKLTEGALKVTAHRLRRRYRELLREEVAHTVAAAPEIDEELRHLIAVLRE